MLRVFGTIQPFTRMLAFLLSWKSEVFNWMRWNRRSARNIAIHVPRKYWQGSNGISSKPNILPFLRSKDCYWPTFRCFFYRLKVWRNEKASAQFLDEQANQFERSVCVSQKKWGCSCRKSGSKPNRCASLHIYETPFWLVQFNLV